MREPSKVSDMATSDPEVLKDLEQTATIVLDRQS